jgi:hypothetical protein
MLMSVWGVYNEPASRALHELVTFARDVPALAWVLVAGACVGHAVLMIGWLNWLYGCAIPHTVLSVTRKLDGLLVLGGWALLGYAFVLHQGTEAGWYPALAGYMVACWLIGMVIFPAITIRRLMRRRPAALVKNDTETLDVAAALGYKPVGNGKYRQLARLPFNDVFRVDFSVRILKVPRLPEAWHGLTILHLSDLHLCGTPDRAFYDYVMDRCRDWQPDLVAVTGDIVDSDTHHRWILPVLGRLRWRIAAFAILGNHDSWRDTKAIRRRLERLGMRVLGNRWETVAVRGEPMVVIGHEGPWFKPGPDLSECPPNVFRLCLSHTPDNIGWARDNNIDLVLAGHVHGGQIRLPLIGSIFVPSKHSRKYDSGTFDEPPTLMHVSRGLAGQHPLRFNCRPEVTLIVLQQASVLSP